MGSPSGSQLWIPMRDGTRLDSRLWLPSSEKVFPVVLQRGYWSGNPDDAHRFTAAGYAYLGQSTRGHGASEGKQNRFFDDEKDGYDTLDWLSKQPWCNGQIAMYGKSYMAMTQWLVAPSGHPALKAIIPQNSPLDLWGHGYWSNGALSFAMTATDRVFDRSKSDEYDWDRLLRFLPLKDLDLEVRDDRSYLWQDYLRHSTYDEFWKKLGVGDRLKSIRIPVFLMAGWYDYYPGAAFEAYRRLGGSSRHPNTRIIVSATDHRNHVVGERDFSGGGKDEVGLAIRWLDGAFGRAGSYGPSDPPISIFTMGINRWRHHEQWPPAEAKETKWYLRSDHGLSLSPPAANDAPSEYEYDPANPVPSLGGNHSCLLDIPKIRAGAVDQRPNESRSDLLAFTSPPLSDDTEVTGPISVCLYASSSARDTDWVARLIDVYPDGTAYNVTEGILRARFRESIWKRPKLLEPRRIYELRLELLPTSNVFRKGHRIRVHVTSSGFPLWDRNLNTGGEIGTVTEMQVAAQRVYHDRVHPSHIVLPVVS